MNSFVLVIVASLISMALALPYDIAEDDSGREYYLVPLHRERRQTTKVDISRSGVASVSHQGNLYSNGNLNVNGGAFASKPVHPNGPSTFGGNLAASHREGHNLNLGASHTEGRGTNFGATGNYNLYQANRGNTRLDAVGSYSRHYGEPYGTGRPNSYGGLQFSHRF